MFVRKLGLSSCRAGTGGGTIFGSSIVSWIEGRTRRLVVVHLSFGFRHSEEGGGGTTVTTTGCSFIYHFANPTAFSIRPPVLWSPKRGHSRGASFVTSRSIRDRHTRCGCTWTDSTSTYKVQPAGGPAMPADVGKRNTSRMDGEWAEREDGVGILLRWRVCARGFRRGKVVRHQPVQDNGGA